MKKFIIAFYKDETQLGELRRRIKTWLPKEAPFHHRNMNIYHFKKGRMLVSTISSETQAFTSYESDYITSKSGLIFDGAPFFKGFSGRANWAKQIHDVIDDRGPYHCLNTLMGDYCLFKYGELSSFAMSDFLGLCPIFWIENEGTLLVSNRQRLLHRVLLDGGVSIEPLAASWLTGQGNIFGVRSIYEGVQIVPPGSFLKIESGSAKVTGMPRFFQPDERCSDYSTSQLTEMAGALFEQADAMSELPFDTMMGDLTGGMDSRAVMALMAGSRMRDKLGSFRTFGQGETAEVQVAKRVASVAGVRHEPISPAPPSMESTENLWRRLRLNVALTDGTILANAAIAGPSRHLTLSASGTGGEVVRPHIKSRRSIQLTSREMAYSVYENYQQSNDPLSCQLVEISKQQKRFIRGATDRYHSMGASFDDVHYAFYGEHRCPWWSGYALSNAFGRRRVFPLANYRAVKIAFSANALQRKIDRYHFEVMRHYDMEIVKVPFLDNKWDDRLKEYSSEEFISPPHPSSAGNPDNPWYMEMADREWNALFDLILSKENSVVRDIIDPEKLKARYREKAAWVKRSASVTALLALASLRLLEDEDYTMEKQGEQPGSTTFSETVFN